VYATAPLCNGAGCTYDTTTCGGTPTACSAIATQMACDSQAGCTWQ
jgi:hypothetical protein